MEIFLFPALAGFSTVIAGKETTFKNFISICWPMTQLDAVDGQLKTKNR